MDNIRLEAAEPARRPLLVAALLAVLGAVFLMVGVYLLSLGALRDVFCATALMAVGVWAILVALGS